MAFWCVQKIQNPTNSNIQKNKPFFFKSKLKKGWSLHRGQLFCFNVAANAGLQTSWRYSRNSFQLCRRLPGHWSYGCSLYFVIYVYNAIFFGSALFAATPTKKVSNREASISSLPLLIRIIVKKIPPIMVATAAPPERWTRNHNQRPECEIYWELAILSTSVVGSAVVLYFLFE